MNFKKRLNQILIIIIYKKFIFIFYCKFLIYIIKIIKNYLFINNKFENIRFINIINK